MVVHLGQGGLKLSKSRLLLLNHGSRGTVDKLGIRELGLALGNLLVKPVNLFLQARLFRLKVNFNLKSKPQSTKNLNSLEKLNHGTD